MQTSNNNIETNNILTTYSQPEIDFDGMGFYFFYDYNYIRSELLK